MQLATIVQGKSEILKHINRHCDAKSTQSHMKTLTLNGIMYPPAKTFASDEKRDLRHECEEFTIDELDELVAALPNIPVLVEHNESDLVGEITSARRTHCNAVEVTATVSASSKNGRAAIQDILDRKLVGLSLSHSYKFNAKPGSETAESIRIAVCEGKDWSDATGTGHNVRKTIREVSLCAQPARYSCNIHNIVCASANAKQQTSSINEENNGQSLDCIDTSVVGFFSCSNNTMPEIENPATQTETETQQPQPPIVEMTSTHQAEKIEDPTMANMVEQVEEVEGIDVKDVQCTTEAMKEAMIRMTHMQNRVQELERTNNDSLVEMNKRQVEQAKCLQVEKDRCALLEQQAKNQQTEQLQKARTDKNNTFAELQKCLSSLKTYNGPETISSSASEKEQLVVEQGLASAAISAIVESEKKKSTMQSENVTLKRKQSDMQSNLGNFGGVPVMKTARVDASADACNNKRFASGKEQDLQTWREHNPNALYHQVNAKFFELQNSANVKTAGIVNASSQQWTEHNLKDETTPNNIASCCSARDLQRELFNRISQMNTGRMINGEETGQMMDGINAHTGRQY